MASLSETRQPPPPVAQPAVWRRNLGPRRRRVSHCSLEGPMNHPARHPSCFWMSGYSRGWRCWPYALLQPDSCTVNYAARPRRPSPWTVGGATTPLIDPVSTIDPVGPAQLTSLAKERRVIEANGQIALHIMYRWSSQGYSDNSPALTNSDHPVSYCCRFLLYSLP